MVVLIGAFELRRGRSLADRVFQACFGQLSGNGVGVAVLQPFQII